MSQQTPMTAGDNPVARRLLIAWSTALFALVCYLPTLFIAYWRGHFRGTLQDAPRFLFLDELLTVLAGMMWLVGLGFLISAAMAWSKSKQRSAAVRIGLTALMVATLPISFFALGSRPEHHLRGFRDGLKTVPVDYNSIRRWRTRQGMATKIPIPRNRWPAAIRSLEPQVVMLADQQKTIVIYGGGLGQWGVTVLSSPSAPRGPNNVAPGVEAWFNE